MNGTASDFLYDGVNVGKELASGTATANLLTGLGLDGVFTSTDSLAPRSFVTAAIGSTVELADGSGTVRTSYVYGTYGNATASGEANASAVTGRENDATGLYYYRNRYYSPTTARFISEDPIGLAGGVNLYAYLGGNPVTFTDTLGLRARAEELLTLLIRLQHKGRTGATLTGYSD